MTKEQAKQVLMNLINQLKVTKAEYDALAKAVEVLAAEKVAEAKDGKQG